MQNPPGPFDMSTAKLNRYCWVWDLKSCCGSAPDVPNMDVDGHVAEFTYEEYIITRGASSEDILFCVWFPLMFIPVPPVSIFYFIFLCF